MKLYTKISIGLILGVIAGWLFGERATYIEPLGKAFIRLITMVVIPLVFASLIVGAANLGDLKKLGRIGIKTFIYFTITTSFAITIGIVLANIIQPGSGLSDDVKTQLLQNYQGIVQGKIESAQKVDIVTLLLQMIPTNPVKSASEGDMLAIIFFAIFFGSILTVMPKDKFTPIYTFFDSLNEIAMKMVHVVMIVAPYGVFALIAGVVGRFGLEILIPLGKYALVVLAGLLIHFFGTYGLSVATLGRLNPIKFYKAMREAQLIAFSTSSSSATLPVNMECVEENLGVSKEVTSFVLPLGATVNMDGTALYQGVAAVFIAQVYGIPLDFTSQLLIVLTATLASIGAAGVPGAGMITLTMVLQTIGVPLEGIALILGVDRILDMCRTVVNITGDATCAVFIARTEGENLNVNKNSKLQIEKK
jgi:Na+/H+-dicarboxylate symporter